MNCPCCGTPNIDHYAARLYLSECKNGHEFKWGYKAGERVSYIAEKNCDCDIDGMRIIKERVQIDA